MSLARGRFPGRLALPDLAPDILAFYRLHWRGKDLYHRPGIFPLLTGQQLFGIDQPLSLDVGCATGEFICGLAQEYPDRLFLGVEMARKPIEHAVARAANLQLHNIRFLQADMTLVAPLLVAQSMQLLSIHFPVPYTTTHKRKHLTYGPRMLEHYRRALVSGGRISIVSDSQQVADDVQQMMADAADFSTVPPAQWQISLDDHLASPYQLLWAKRKRTIWRAEYEKGDGGR